MILWLSFSFNPSTTNHYDCRKQRSCDLGFLQFAVVPNFQGEQLTNRDSASWKKAEHIVVEEIQRDEGLSLLPKWRMLTAAEPVGLSPQKLYVAIGGGSYAMYDARGNGPTVGLLVNLVK